MSRDVTGQRTQGSGAVSGSEPREVQRHLFPLPELKNVAVGNMSSLSRGVQQRVARRHAVTEEANSMIRALNVLSGAVGARPNCKF